MQKDFELLPHTADLKIRVYGSTLEQFFHHALIGMFQSIGPQARGCERRGDRLYCPELPQHHELELQAHDLPSLLVDFLSEALSLSDIHNEAYLDVTIHKLDQNYIKATLHGVPIQGFEVFEIKAVTYHDLRVEQINGVWQADIVFDI